MHGAFLPNIKWSGYKIWIQFNWSPLDIEQNNYTTKTIKGYIAFDLENWPKPNHLFGLTVIVKNSGKEKHVYCSCGIAFDWKGEWNFGNHFASNFWCW